MIFTKSDVMCNGDADGSIDITVAGGTKPYAFAWSNGSTNEDLTDLVAGSYILNVIDNLGYTLIDTIIVEQPDPIIITGTVYADVINIMVSGGIPPYSYLWSTGDTTQNLLNYDQTNCSVSVVDSNNCTGFKEFQPVSVDDGSYIVGDGTGLFGLHENGIMNIALNEVVNEEREELLDKYIAIEGESAGFNIIEVNGSNQTTLGPGIDFALVSESELNVDEPKAGLWRGSLVETNEKFTVPEHGLYHVAYDKELMIIVIAKVEWGVIGSATPQGWSLSTDLPASGFDLNTMTFEIPEITLFENEWRFRYSNGWNVILDPDFNNGSPNAGLKVNCNFGGQISDLVPGGGNFINDEYAIYKIIMNWVLGVGHTASVVWVSEAEPIPVYPDMMYIVGEATAYGWATPGDVDDAIMHKCAGGAPTEGIFWKICHIESGLGFKVSDANWGSFNFGFAEIDEFDVDGITVSDQEGNMTISESGMYIVVLDLRNDAIKLSIKEAEVYGMGDTFGGWDEDLPANLFTIDNVAKTLTSPAFVADGNIRMYAQHPWIQDWWNAEFNVYSGVIEYRNDGGDQEAVPGTAGQVVILIFDHNTGDIQ